MTMLSDRERVDLLRRYDEERPEGIAWGECWCGCGEAAPVAKVTDRSRGVAKGWPRRYRLGHYGRTDESRARSSAWARSSECRERTRALALTPEARRRSAERLAAWNRTLEARERTAERNRRPAARIMVAESIDLGHETPCLIYTDTRHAEGYGLLPDNTLAHRNVYAFATGRPIPQGHHVHHRCRNRACVRFDHMEMLSASEHARLHAAERKGSR